MTYKIHHIETLVHKWGSVHFLNHNPEFYVMTQKDHRDQSVLVEIVRNGFVLLHKKTNPNFVPETIMEMIRLA